MKYTRFHTTALCSPTRAALLLGRNHHAVGMGGITEIATSAPGYNSLRPKVGAFTGRVRWVQIDLEVDDHDHLISPEERLRIAMTRQ